MPAWKVLQLDQRGKKSRLSDAPDGLIWLVVSSGCGSVSWVDPALVFAKAFALLSNVLVGIVEACWGFQPHWLDTQRGDDERKE